MRPQHHTSLSMILSHGKTPHSKETLLLLIMPTALLPSLPPPACSYFEMEQEEYAKRGVTLSVEAWLVKLMVRESQGGRGGVPVSELLRK